MQIISGKGNPLARAAARGEASQERAMQQAVAYDLDTLQRLAVTETTLSGTHTTDASLNYPQSDCDPHFCSHSFSQCRPCMQWCTEGGIKPSSSDPRVDLRVCSRK